MAGRFSWETNVSARLILFLDHQNAYKDEGDYLSAADRTDYNLAVN